MPHLKSMAESALNRAESLRGPRLQARGVGEAGLRDLAGMWPSASPLLPPAAHQQPCRLSDHISHQAAVTRDRARLGAQPSQEGTCRLPPRLTPACFQFQGLKLRVKAPHPQRQLLGPEKPRNGARWPRSTAWASTAGRPGCVWLLSKADSNAASRGQSRRGSGGRKLRGGSPSAVQTSAGGLDP